ncbi:MAG: fibronectin type III domain-containing protein [Acidobacteria bacterium]|nr:fibronectin type III domain-containing protein [Acidobacteriota bacterium]
MTTGVTRPATVATALAAAMLGVGCGKKGAPMAPFVRIPAAVEAITASRFGTSVYVTFTVPTANIDTSIPVDISRIDVYGYTGRVAPTPARWAELGTVVATIPVAPPPVGEAGAAPPPQADATSEGALPGTPVTILDTLTPEELIQGAIAAVDPRRPELVPLPGMTMPTVLRRFYLAVPFSQRGRPGPPGMQAELVLTMLPEPPTDVRASYAPATLSLAWEPSGGLLGFLLDRALPPESLPFETLQPPGPVVPQPVDASVPPGPTTYNVYRELALDPFVLPPAATRPSWRVAAPVALNPAPLASTATTDAVDLGRARCYTVRAQRGAVISEPSPPACITPIDVFPPGAPAGLATVPSEGGISLIWEPNAEIDLGGYLVLRREAGDATLRQLTDTPIGEARYRDTTVRAGTRYLYSVVAVDTQLPLPNVSTQSELVEETAR